MAIKIEHRVWLPNGTVVDYVQGRYVKVERDRIVYTRAVDDTDRAVYEVTAYGRRVKVGNSWGEVDPELAAAVLEALAALVIEVEEISK